MGRGPLLVVALVAVVGACLWASSRTRPGADATVTREATAGDAVSDTAPDLADLGERTRETVARSAADGAAEATVTEQRAVIESEPARFEVVVLDHERLPVAGVQASGVVRAWRPDAERSASTGGWGARSAHNGAVVARVSGAELVSDARGRIVLDLERPDHRALREGARALEAELTLYPPFDGPYARVEGVRVDDGATMTVVLARSGALEVTLAALAGGVVPHVARPRIPRVEGLPPSRNHTDVVLVLEAADGSRPSALRGDAVDSKRWEGLRPGRYRLIATTDARGSHSPLAVLDDLVVESGRDCDDLRLVGWDPFADHEPMLVEVVRVDGSTPDPLVVGYVLDRGISASWQQADYDGRRLPIVGVDEGGVRVYFEGRGTQRITAEIRPGAQTVVLPGSIRLHLRLRTSTSEVTGPIEFELKRQREPRPDVPIGPIAIPVVVERGRSDVEVDLPAPGTYQLRTILPHHWTGGEGEPPWFPAVLIEVPDAPVVERTVLLEAAD